MSEYDQDAYNDGYEAGREVADEDNADAARYRWMKQNVKRIPPGWELIGWDAAIDRAMAVPPGQALRGFVPAENCGDIHRCVALQGCGGYNPTCARKES